MSALVMALGAVAWMHPTEMGGWGGTGFILGLLGVLGTMFMWWSDVISEAHAGDHTPVVSLHLRYGMILFIASEVMFFVGWFWSFFDFSLFPSALPPIEGLFPSKGIEVMNAFELPLLNTLILLCSGTTVTWAHHALIHGDRDGLKKGLWCTIILGILFTSIQGYEYYRAPFNFGTTTLWLGLLHGDRLPWLPRHRRHDLPDRGTSSAPIRATSPPASISASRQQPGTGTSSTWSGCSCSAPSMCGVAGAHRSTAADARRQRLARRTP